MDQSKNKRNIYVAEDENQDAPQGWTRIEKYDLLHALKTYGSHNLELIHQLVSTKSIEEIKELIDYYKQKALEHPLVTKKKKVRRYTNTVSRAPLAMWAKFLTDSINYDELQTETATALRLIAEFENIPSHLVTQNIDFRIIYHALANALEGKSVTVDPVVSSILEKCIVEAACTSKSFVRYSSLKQVIDSVILTDISKFPRPTENNELATLRYLVAQRNYNPLNIDEGFLQPTLLNQSKE